MGACLNRQFGAWVVAIGLFTVLAGEGLIADPASTSTFANLAFIVGMPPGGSVDAYARLIQRHIAQFLPGNPSIMVQNKPGAGSLLSVMAMINSPPTDDLALATFSSSLIPNAVAEPERFKIDFRRLPFIGKVGEDYRVCYVRRDTNIHSLQELGAHSDVIFAATAAGTSGNLNLAILKDLFKVRLRVVLGYAGSAAKRLAFERGEVDGDCGGIESIPAEWIADKKINILLRFLPDLMPPIDQSVPFAGDLLTSEADRQLYDFLTTPERLAGMLIVSERIAKARVAELRDAFSAMASDPGFQTDAGRLGFPIAAVSGAELQNDIARLYATPPDVLQHAKALLQE